MNAYLKLVTEYVRLTDEGRTLPLGIFPTPAYMQPEPDAPTVMIFSPHPDDEVIIGGLALRLMRESSWRAINVAVTHGSKLERKAARAAELTACCQSIGFELIHAAPEGLDDIVPKARAAAAPHWASAVHTIRGILARHRPSVILVPHEHDSHPTHIGTHFLVMDALESMPAEYSPHLVETEFWGQMQTPNLMVAIRPEDLADLITALTFHVGEVTRNPYHVTLPAWMIDNVRRGSELVGGHGATARNFYFATLYRLRRRKGGRMENTFDKGRSLGTDENPADLFAER